MSAKITGLRETLNTAAPQCVDKVTRLKEVDKHKKSIIADQAEIHSMRMSKNRTEVNKMPDSSNKPVGKTKEGEVGEVESS